MSEAGREVVLGGERVAESGDMPLMPPILPPGIKGAVSRNSARLGNCKMPVKLRET